MSYGSVKHLTYRPVTTGGRTSAFDQAAQPVPSEKRSEKRRSAESAPHRIFSKNLGLSPRIFTGKSALICPAEGKLPFSRGKHGTSFEMNWKWWRNGGELIDII